MAPPTQDDAVTSSYLELIDVTRRFGGLTAVDGLTCAVTRGTVHGVIGPNGAGKSTAFNLISGLTPVSSGRILLDGRDITRLAIEKRVEAGICRTFQTPRLFEEMTVLETVMVGRHRHGRMGILGSIVSFGAKRREERAIEADAHRLLAAVGLERDAAADVRHLSYGKRRLLEIARALATEPSLLLIDEVTSGLNPVETEGVSELIRRLAANGLTVVLVEHDMRFVMNLCDRITVLNFGARIAEGTAAEIAIDETVITAYLGRPAGSRERRPPRRQGIPT
jgi:branched-chain amino acid transport system ATP-binding protein